MSSRRVAVERGWEKGKTEEQEKGGREAWALKACRTKANEYEAAMEALVGAAENHGHVVVKVDDAATAGLVARFERTNKSNMATNYLAGSS